MGRPENQELAALFSKHQRADRKKVQAICNACRGERKGDSPGYNNSWNTDRMRRHLESCWALKELNRSIPYDRSRIASRRTRNGNANGNGNGNVEESTATRSRPNISSIPRNQAQAQSSPLNFGLPLPNSSFSFPAAENENDLASPSEPAIIDLVFNTKDFQMSDITFKIPVGMGPAEMAYSWKERIPIVVAGIENSLRQVSLDVDVRVERGGRERDISFNMDRFWDGEVLRQLLESVVGHMVK